MPLYMIWKREKEWLKMHKILEKTYIKQKPKLQGMKITESLSNERNKIEPLNSTEV